MIKPLPLFALLITLSFSYPVTEAMGQLTTPPAQEPTNDGVLILGSSQISTDFGSTYIVGEVRNNLSDIVEYVQIVGSFYDSSGLLIDTDFTYTDLDYLRPAEKSPFKLIISDESVASRINNYTLSVNWEPVYANASAVAAATVLTIQEGEQRIGEFGWYEVVGEVVNGGTDSTEYVKVVATFYDEAGQVINTDYTYTDPSDLAAGQSAPFELTVSDEDIAEDIESVKLSAQSQDYFGVDPELTASTPTTPTTPTLSSPEQQQQDEQQQQPSPSPLSEQLVL
jgi:hypothetical protein